MYFQVIFISNICNGQGTVIETQFWTGNKILDVYNYLWPQAHKPSTGNWAHWQLALTRSLNLGHAQKLAILLGKWLLTMQQLNGWFTDSEGLQLYKQVNHKWFSFTPCPL